MTKIIELSGLRFGRLLVKSKLEEKGLRGKTLWECLCDCGNIIKVPTGSLSGYNTKSCGCLNRDRLIQRNKENATHGLSRTPLYINWGGMIQRCTNIKDPHFKDYGARGIKVCDRWRSFENFLADMGPKPTPDHSIERRNNNGNYEPSNCYWGTYIDQANNRRSNTLLLYKDKEYTATQLAREHGINVETFYYRLTVGWTIEEAVETPIKGN